MIHLNTWMKCLTVYVPLTQRYIAKPVREVK